MTPLRRFTCRLALVFAAGLMASCAMTTHGPSRPLRIVSYNIKHGHGMDDEVDLARIADVLRSLSPDVVLLQEVDQGCARSGAVDQAQWLGQALGLESRFGAFRPYDGGLYGMAALSALPIEAAEVVPLPPGPNPLTALEIRLEHENGPLIVTGLHLVQTEAQRLAQARFLALRYADVTTPVVLAGDLNSEPASPVLRALEATFFAAPKAEPANTFPSHEPIKEIDFVLLSRGADWSIHEHRVIPETLASDHRPLVLDVTIGPISSSPGTRSGR